MSVFVNSSECLSKSSVHQLLESGCFDLSLEKVKCVDSYGYVQERNYSGEFWSLASEKLWVCDQSYLAAQFYSAKNLGLSIGMIVLMQQVDK